MREDVKEALIPIVVRKLQCTRPVAEALVDAWIQRVTQADADAFVKSWDASRVAAHAARGGADVAVLTTGFGTLVKMGVLQLMNWAPEELRGTGVACKEGQINTSVASAVGCSAAAGGAAVGSEVLTAVTLGPGADLATVNAALQDGPLWRDLLPENDGGGVDRGCGGCPPSPELAKQCKVETAHALATLRAATALRTIVPRGEEVTKFLLGLFADGARIGLLGDVRVDTVDVTAELAGPLSPATRGLTPAYAVGRKLVILTFPCGSRRMILLHVGEFHPSWLTGQLGRGGGWRACRPRTLWHCTDFRCLRRLL